MKTIILFLRTQDALLPHHSEYQLLKNSLKSLPTEETPTNGVQEKIQRCQRIALKILRTQIQMALSDGNLKTFAALCRIVQVASASAENAEVIIPLASTKLSQADWMRLAILWKLDLLTFFKHERFAVLYSEPGWPPEPAPFWGLVKATQHPWLSSSSNLFWSNCVISLMLIISLHTALRTDELVRNNIDQGIFHIFTILSLIFLPSILSVLTYLFYRKFIQVHPSQNLYIEFSVLSAVLLYAAYCYYEPENQGYVQDITINTIITINLIDTLHYFNLMLPIFFLERMTSTLLVMSTIFIPLRSDVFMTMLNVIISSLVLEVYLLFTNQILNKLEEPYFIKDLQNVAGGTLILTTQDAKNDAYVIQTQAILQQKAALIPPRETLGLAY